MCLRPEARRRTHKQTLPTVSLSDMKHFQRVFGSVFVCGGFAISLRIEWCGDRELQFQFGLRHLARQLRGEESKTLVEECDWCKHEKTWACSITRNYIFFSGLIWSAAKRRTWRKRNAEKDNIKHRRVLLRLIKKEFFCCEHRKYIKKFLFVEMCAFDVHTQNFFLTSLHASSRAFEIKRGGHDPKKK